VLTHEYGDQGSELEDAGNDIDGAPHDNGPPDLGADERGVPELG
jgi:hypothetical protein